MRLAWFSPLPPFTSGIGDYSFELLPFIAERAEVDVFCPDRSKKARGPIAPAGLPIIAPELFATRAHRYEAVFHHMGNNPDHEFVFDAARSHPGISVFHDLVQHHLLADDIGKPEKFSRFVGLMEREYGEAGRSFVELALRRVNTQFEKFLFPLNATVARGSRAIVVHSLASRERMLEVAPGVPVTVIPHHRGRPPESVAGVDRDEARARLGLPRDAFLIGQFGFITKPKQPGALLGGFARFRAAVPEALLLVVGMNQAGPGLVRLIARHGLQDHVRLTGYVDLARMYLYLRAVDAVINLRYPSAGETSGTVARSLGEGRATIVSNIAAFADLAAGVVLKVEVDSDQAEAVAGHLRRLADDGVFRADLEAGARRYAETVLDPGRCADLYVEVAESTA